MRSLSLTYVCVSVQLFFSSSVVERILHDDKRTKKKKRGNDWQETEDVLIVRLHGAISFSSLFIEFLIEVRD